MLAPALMVRSLICSALVPLLAFGLCACSTPAAAPNDGSPPATTVAPAATTMLSSSGTGAAPDPSPGPSASVEPTPTAAPVLPLSPTSSLPISPTSSASSTPDGPIPNVKVANIGMHIGGGPNDAPTKAPIKSSVEPHFDALKRCWSRIADPTKGGDFGADLLIAREGGKAKISHPRTSLKGEGFKECIVAVFEAIDFKKPKGGTTVVSYSIRFTP